MNYYRLIKDLELLQEVNEALRPENLKAAAEARAREIFPPERLEQITAGAKAALDDFFLSKGV